MSRTQNSSITSAGATADRSGAITPHRLSGPLPRGAAAGRGETAGHGYSRTAVGSRSRPPAFLLAFLAFPAPDKSPDVIKNYRESSSNQSLVPAGAGEPALCSIFVQTSARPPLTSHSRSAKPNGTRGGASCRLACLAGLGLRGLVRRCFTLSPPPPPTSAGVAPRLLRHLQGCSKCAILIFSFLTISFVRAAGGNS